jgi:hypothetical protein
MRECSRLLLRAFPCDGAPRSLSLPLFLVPSITLQYAPSPRRKVITKRNNYPTCRTISSKADSKLLPAITYSSSRGGEHARNNTNANRDDNENGWFEKRSEDEWYSILDKDLGEKLKQYLDAHYEGKPSGDERRRQTLKKLLGSKDINILRLVAGLPRNSTVKRSIPQINAPSSPVLEKLDDPVAWISLIERALPVHYRRDVSTEQDVEDEGRLPLPWLLTVLSRARAHRNIDLLSELGLTYGRWQAVLWIIKALLNSQTSGNVDSRIALGQVWQSLGNMILVAEAYENTPNSPASNSDWNAKLGADGLSSSLSYVQQILAHLHHIGLVPTAVYNDTSTHPSLFRPATLHLLSSRILTSLSDAVWRAHEEQTLAKAALTGSNRLFGMEIPGSRYKLKVRSLGPEVWLDFVLWCCVEGGYYKEGASIIQQMEKTQRNWSLISWDAIQTQNQVDWDRVKSRTGGVVGRIEGYSFDEPFVELGTRNISIEVVKALLYGLVDSVDTPSSIRSTNSTTLDLIRILQNHLNRNPDGDEASSSVLLLLRQIESRGLTPEADLKRFERALLQLSKPPKRDMVQTLKRASACSDDHETPANPLHAYLHLHYRALAAHIGNGDLLGAMRTWSLLQNVLDELRQASISEFVDQIRKRETIRTLKKKPDSVMQTFRVPKLLVASLLHLATELRAFEVADWLLRNESVTGPEIEEKDYSVTRISVALIDYAAATADEALIMKVMSKTRRPLHQHVLRALLRCYIDFDAWDMVDELMEHMVRPPKTWTWSQKELATLTRKICILTHTARSTEEGMMQNQQRLKRATNVFIRLVSGPHGQVIPDDHLVDKYPPKVYMEHLKYVLSTASPTIARLCSIDTTMRPARMRLFSMPVDAFNTILRGVVESRGAIAGKSLWDAWCRNLASRKTLETRFEASKISFTDGVVGYIEDNTSVISSMDIVGLGQAIVGVQDHDARQCGNGNGNDNKIVTPNLVTLDILIEASLQEHKTLRKHLRRSRKVIANPQSSLDTLRMLEERIIYWGRSLYSDFGLTRYEIKIKMNDWFRKKIDRNVFIKKGERLQEAISNATRKRLNQRSSANRRRRTHQNTHKRSLLLYNSIRMDGSVRKHLAKNSLTSRRDPTRGRKQATVTNVRPTYPGLIVRRRSGPLSRVALAKKWINEATHRISLQGNLVGGKRARRFSVDESSM